MKLRWPKDQRVGEVRRLLQSSQPVSITIQQRPEVSDHEFIEEQEKHVEPIELKIDHKVLKDTCTKLEESLAELEENVQTD